MLLAGDVGGTKTNLALYSTDGDLLPEVLKTYPSTGYSSLEAVVTEFLAETGASVERAVIGVAGPVVEGKCSGTNLPWTMHEETLKRELGLLDAKLLNDLEATGYGVLHLSPKDLFVLNDAPARDATKAIIAPGTGLGEAVLFYQHGRYHIIPSEGGHTDFGPNNLFEIELLRYLMGKFAHVSYERICSGIGLPFIYGYLRDNRYAPEIPSVVQALQEAEDPTPVIVRAAMAGECDLCIAALNSFVSILGAEAGNLTLKVMAMGGIYIGGGIPPRILSKLRDGTFMSSFVNKGRFADTLSRVPVYVVLNPKTALLGAAWYGFEMY